MTKKNTDNLQEVDQDASPVNARPTRLSRSLKLKSSPRSRRRKGASAPGGIHQRANKRMSW
jgi:hypothetical protein